MSLAVQRVEGTRALPVLIVRAEGRVEELGELNAVLLAGDFVVVFLRVVAANAEQNFDTLGLAVRNVLLDGEAVAQEPGRDLVLVLVGRGPAVTGEVGARVPGVVVLRGDVDKAESDVLDTRVTVVGQAFNGRVAILALLRIRCCLV